MTRYWRPALALLGGAVVVAIVLMIGPGVILDGVRRAGWIIVPILLLQGLSYALNAVAWWLVMPRGDDRPTLLEVFRISVIGFAFNFVTPIVNAGGEPYRVAALAPRLGLARATGSVLLYVLVHAVTSIAFWLLAILLTAFVLPWAPAPRAALLAVALVLLVALVAVLSGQRDGVVARLVRLVEWLRLRRLAAWLAARRAAITLVDAEIVQAWRDRPGHLLVSIGIDLGSRGLAALELTLLALALGISLDPGTALAIWGFMALTVNLFFFVPWELGSREGAVYGLSQAAALPIEFAGLAVVIGRIREVVWAALGMGLLAWEGRKTRPRFSN